MDEIPQNPYQSPQAPQGAPAEIAPGAQAAKVCGILSIPFGILCFPVGIVLAIVALVKQGKAKGFARAYPDRYMPVSATGMVTAIIGLLMVPIFGVLGMISAIAIPALLSQRSRVRDRQAMENLVGGTGDLVNQFDKLREAQTPLPEIPARLESELRSEHGLAKNPWNMAAPAYSFHIQVVQGLDSDGMESAASALATTLGQTVYVIELPTPQQPGYLAGAVRTQNGPNESSVRTKVSALE